MQAIPRITGGVISGWSRACLKYNATHFRSMCEGDRGGRVSENCVHIDAGLTSLAQNRYYSHESRLKVNSSIAIRLKRKQNSK